MTSFIMQQTQHEALGLNTSDPSLPPRMDSQHPLCTGEFVVAVFCGHREAMGELAGEATARLHRKYVLPDTSLPTESDFARSIGATLPAWNAACIRPINGVCFVLSNANHSALALLREKGAIEGEHFVLTSGLASQDDPDIFRMRLQSFVAALAPRASIAILGYGQQGQRIAACLREDFGIARSRLHIWDSNDDSRAKAATDGLALIEDAHIESRVKAVIASPLDSFARIEQIISRLRDAGVPVLDNARRASRRRHWIKRGQETFLDRGASRVIRVGSSDVNHNSITLSLDEAILRPSVTAHIVRLDQRILASVHMPHLQGGQTHRFEHETINLAQQWEGDGLAPDTFAGLRRAYISLSPRASLGFFAARDMCLDLWPNATQSVFPSEHEIDLGTTAFERLLKAHLDACEIVATMQTPAQRVTLGVVAAHYADNRPVIEIGSALGGSMLHIAAAIGDTAGRVPLISIDPDSATRDIMRLALQRHGCGDRLQQIVRTSDAAVSELQSLRASCGLIFIDGLHTAAAVVSDFRNYGPLVTVGGALAFHDVCPAIHSVMQAIVSEVLPDKRFAARCLVDGLLVLERVR